MLKPKPYVKLASAEFADCRIERIFIKARWAEAIRLSDWRGARFNRRALVMPEDELIVLIGDAIAAKVFSQDFLVELEGVMATQMGDDIIPVRVIRFLSEGAPKPFCDDCIAESLSLSRRQQANRVTTTLGLSGGGYTRAVGICSRCGQEKKVIARAHRT